jgi:hypothetical protein
MRRLFEYFDEISPFRWREIATVCVRVWADRLGSFPMINPMINAEANPHGHRFAGSGLSPLPVPPKSKTPVRGAGVLGVLVAGTGFEPVTFRL